MRILLVEPGYRNKYPPLALMKLSTYHKQLNDEVVFCKGIHQNIKKQKWDRIYITTVFTFHWDIVVRTIKFYLNSVANPNNLYIGGAMATIMAKELLSIDGFQNIFILKGLLDKPGMLDDNNIIVDELIPDYSILESKENNYLNYEYPINNAYFIHATRGCIRKCEFCAVPIIEPVFKGYCSIKSRIEEINSLYGTKKDLMIMDNNILASPHFERIVQEIVESGFGKDNNEYIYYINNRKVTTRRYVDFNQGLDARLIYSNPEKLELISRLAIRPLRIAFDHADDDFINIYTQCMDMAAELNIKYASNYILFNFEDTPGDFYKRLRINVELNKSYQDSGKSTQIWSFPMRFSPLFGEHAKDRKFVGKHWTSKQIRAIQCILNATHGVVGPKLSFFEKAFGKNIFEFNELLYMPEKYIINRNEYESSGLTNKWRQQLNALSESERTEFMLLIKNNTFIAPEHTNKKILALLKHYI